MYHHADLVTNIDRRLWHFFGSSVHVGNISRQNLVLCCCWRYIFKCGRDTCQEVHFETVLGQWPSSSCETWKINSMFIANNTTLGHVSRVVAQPGEISNCCVYVMVFSKGATSAYALSPAFSFYWIYCIGYVQRLTEIDIAPCQKVFLHPQQRQRKCHLRRVQDYQKITMTSSVGQLPTLPRTLSLFDTQVRPVRVPREHLASGVKRSVRRWLLI